MLLKQIKYFLTVVDCGSFTEAAERCYISQSAVSQQMKVLESELGVKLLHREKRKFTLTEAGKYMYKHGAALLHEAETLKEDLAKIGRSEGSIRIVIGYLKGYSGRELQAAIAAFIGKYPQIVIDVKSAGHEELYEGLNSGRFNFVLNDMPFDGGEFTNLMLAENNCCIDISSANELSGKPYVEMEELKKLPCILVAAREERDAGNEAVLTGSPDFENKLIFAGDWEEARMLTASGAGFMLVENAYRLYVPESEGVTRIPVYKDGKPAKWCYYLISRKRGLNEYQQYMAQLVQDKFRSSAAKA